MKTGLSTIQMMEETKRTGKVAAIVCIPDTLEPYKDNWLGSGMFYDAQYDRYCVNQWIKNFGYPSFKPNQLRDDSIRKEIKWMLDETIEVVKPLKDCSVGYHFYT